MSAEFFAAILEGFEGTLDEVLVRSLPMGTARNRQSPPTTHCCTARTIGSARSLQPGRLTPSPNQLGENP